ncbi:hypothetical protein RQP46_007243 [Phenoliferia psychrophenolica]
MVLLLNCASYWFSASLGPLKTILKDELKLNNSQFAVISAAGNLVNTVVPVISGVAIDYYGPEGLSLGASSIILVGAVVAGIGASEKSYGALLVGEIVVGLGSVTIETAQLKMYTTWFRGHHLGLVFGVNHAFNHLINLTAKATAVPISLGTHSWTWAIWVPVFVSAFVLAVNFGYCAFERRLPSQYRLPPGRAVERALGKHHGFLKQLTHAWAILIDLPAVFWIVTLTQDQVSAGLIAALAQVPVIVFSPFVGWIMDRFGHRMAMSPFASAFFIVVFALVGWTQVSGEAISIVQGVALALNFIPFTLAVPILVPSLAYMGTAQGTYSAFINAGHVIVVTASGAIQDNSPKGRHSYDNVLYFLLALKFIDFFLGLFYMALDRIALNGILTRPAAPSSPRRVPPSACPHEAPFAHILQSAVQANEMILKLIAWCILGIKK